MTMPEMIQSPRAMSTEGLALAGTAEGGKAVGKALGKANGDFAAALAGIMWAPSAEAAAVAGAAPPDAGATPAVGVDGKIGAGPPGTLPGMAIGGVPGPVEGAAALQPGVPTAGASTEAQVMLDDMAQTVALLPAAVAAGEESATEAAAEGAPEAAGQPVPAAALQAVIAGMVKPGAPVMTEEAVEGKAVPTEDGATEEGGEEEVDEAVAEEAVDPLLALGLAAVAPATTPLAEGEGEMAVAEAVSSALANGIVQPMAAMRPLRTAQLPGGMETAQTAAANGMETSSQAIEGNRPDFAKGEGSGADPGARRDMPLIQQHNQAAERPVTRAAEASAQAQAQATDASVETAQTTQASQPLPQSAQAVTQASAQTLMPGNPAPIAMDRPGWEGAIADRIEAELSGDGQIELDLTPEHLGRLKIRLDMVDGQTMVRFVTETPEAARLIQQNEHRLSETLSRAGLSLGGQETASRDPQGERQARGGGESGGMSYERPVEAKVGTIAVPARAVPGLVNLVA